MTATVRPATTGDLDRIEAMGRDFFRVSGYDAIAPISEEAALGLAIVTMQTGVMLVAEDAGEIVGMACLHVEPWIFNVSVNIAHELAFWIEPGYRGRALAGQLLRAIDEACRARNCRAVRMAKLQSSPPSVDGLYAHHGYQPT